MASRKVSPSWSTASVNEDVVNRPFVVLPALEAVDQQMPSVTQLRKGVEFEPCIRARAGNGASNQQPPHEAWATSNLRRDVCGQLLSHRWLPPGLVSSRLLATAVPDVGIAKRCRGMAAASLPWPMLSDRPLDRHGSLDLSTAATGHVNVLIETPQGQPNKFKYDTKLGMLRLSRVLPVGMVFPYDFGFLPGTRAEDGDPLDVLVLMDAPAYPGTVVEARLVGVLRCKQGKKGQPRCAMTGSSP